MRITIESTERIIQVNGFDCRVWEGVTEKGVMVQAIMPRLAIQAERTSNLLDDANRLPFEGAGQNRWNAVLAEERSRLQARLAQIDQVLLEL
jgi:hypothetical protein